MVPGLVEDTLEVIANLKRIRLKLPMDVEQEVVLYEFTGPNTITSNDLEKPGQVDVLSRDLPLFTLSAKSKLDLELQIEMGRGSVSAETNEQYIEVVGTIPLDAIFTPIPKVKYSIEPCRVGQRNDYDKLIIELWTDGTIAPDDALAEAAKIAKDHFSIFINFKDGDIFLGDDNDELDGRIRKILSTSVDELELSVRSSNCLKNASIRTIGELTRKTEDDIAKTRNFGKKSLDEIRQKLKEWDLYLGMTDYSSLKKSLGIVENDEEAAEAQEEKEEDNES
jgi:DNA-directed RNA polymerase subunit alpha